METFVYYIGVACVVLICALVVILLAYLVGITAFVLWETRNEGRLLYALRRIKRRYQDYEDIDRIRDSRAIRAAIAAAEISTEGALTFLVELSKQNEFALQQSAEKSKLSPGDDDDAKNDRS